MVMEEKYYAILMEKNVISSNIYLFKPRYLIAGKIEEDELTKTAYFIDEKGTEFLNINDVECLTTDDELGVGYVITEEQLLEKYKGLSLNDAKAKYFEQISDVVHIGFYIYSIEKVGICPIDLYSMLDKLNSIDINDDNDIINIPVSELNNIEKLNQESLNQMDNQEFGLTEDAINEIIKEYGYQEVIAMSLEELKNIIDIKDANEIKKKLEEIYNAFKDLKTENSVEFSENIATKDLTGRYIINTFNTSYSCLLSIPSLEEMKRTIEQIIEVYIGLTLTLDEKANQGYDIEKANDYLYSLIGKYEYLLKLDDLNDIKGEICKIRDTEQEKINSLALKYDQMVKEKEIEKKEMIETSSELDNKIDVKAMKKFFDERIIGQEEAKKDVISSIIMNKLSSNPSDRNSCLLVGPTGSGKTLIADTVSKYLNIPMEIVDTTQLTMPGYVGANIEDFLIRLLNKTNGNLTKAEEGIIVFDEIDKKGSEKNEDVSGKGVLNTLLPFLQGTTYDIRYNGKSYHFNTEKLTVFATGAFTDVSKGKNSNSYKETGIGFSSSLNTSSEEDIKYRKLELEDFVKYGNMPVELMGRFTTIAQLSGHTKESLRQILTDSNLSALLSEKEKLNKIGIDLRWTEQYLDEVAKKALKLKTGARSLKSTVEYSIKEVRWEVLNNLDLYKTIILTEGSVNDNFDCELIDKDGNYHNFKDIMGSKEESKEKVLVK